ncbi:MAG TPA: methyltransferase domain-containing protein [Candidatus Methylomirabilis sp.]|nr:methyltransferase domain-containing protein [Candidatus Methylomirabilis sp.]
MIRFLIENDVDEILTKQAREMRLTRQSVALNIACEFQRVPNWLPDAVDPERVFGLEINREIVAKDPNIKYCDVDHNRFPFSDESFDLVFSIFGVEHFKTDNVFREAHRTLMPGGRFLFLVPNVLYPAFLLNKLLGERFAAFYYRRMMRSTYQPHKARYRFNRLGTIRRAARAAGFKQTSFVLFGPANILWYVRRSRIAQQLVALYERILTNKLLFRFKPYILAVLEK